MDLAKSSAPMAIDNIVKSIRGINNSDLSGKLETLKSHEGLLKQIIQNQMVLELKLDMILNQRPPSNFDVMN
jgi:hypothetical protein